MLARLVVTVFLMMASACASTAITPNIISRANIRWEGSHAVRLDLLPTFEELPPRELVRHWHEGRGLQVPDGAHLCGTPITIHGVEEPTQVAYGRLIVFGAHASGEGPAGRGSYQLAVEDTVFGNIAGGRMAAHYESYTSGSQERYAWIVFAAQQPIVCDCKSAANVEDASCALAYETPRSAAAASGKPSVIRRKRSAKPASAH